MANVSYRYVKGLPHAQKLVPTKFVIATEEGKFERLGSAFLQFFH